MTYILLAAGRGTRLKPITISNPKALFMLDSKTSLIEKTISMIRKYDKNASIVVVVGFMHEQFENRLKNVKFVYNPFFDVTNSIASLWLARDYLIMSEGVVIMNADVLVCEELMRDIICKPALKPAVLLDSSIKTNGDYNVEVQGENVLVMSKDLKEYYGEYAGVTLLDKYGAERLCHEVEYMVEKGEYDQWYENALVRAIFIDDFKLKYIDICDYEWTEVDDVNDLVLAKKIHDGR